MNLRAFSPSAGDAAVLAAYECSTGVGYEDDVERWIRNEAVRWLNDMPKTVFQRRQLVLLEAAGEVAAIAAWQDIVRVDLEGIWLEVLAVASASQHGGLGQEAYELVVNELHTVERDGDALAGLVHRDNHRSQRLLARNGWQVIAQWDDDHELWVGSL